MRKYLLVCSFMLFLSVLSTIHAADPAAIPDQNTFGLGVNFEADHRDLDNEESAASVRVMGNLNYTLMKNIQIYLESGLFQTETHHGKNSNWGLGVGFGIRGYFAEFQNGNIRIGFDGHVFRSQTDYSSQSIDDSFSMEEDITRTEYMISATASWRAYQPIVLYTGVQVSKIDVDYEVSTYHWEPNTVTEEGFEAEEDQMIGLLWGVTYELADNVHLFGELKSFSNLSVLVGFDFSF